jgi:hypothetical protein
VDFILIIVSLSSIYDSGHLIAPGKEINAGQTTHPFDDPSSAKTPLGQFLLKSNCRVIFIDQRYPILSLLYVKKNIRIKIDPCNVDNFTDSMIRDSRARLRMLWNPGLDHPLLDYVTHRYAAEYFFSHNLMPMLGCRQRGFSLFPVSTTFSR